MLLDQAHDYLRGRLVLKLDPASREVNGPGPHTVSQSQRVPTKPAGPDSAPVSTPMRQELLQLLAPELTGGHQHVGLSQSFQRELFVAGL